MTNPTKRSPLAPGTRAGFGFEEIMRRPDHSRFIDWYARFSFFAASRLTSPGTGRPR
jgi:hypothetical protein